jgi:hypothetical protein
VYYQLYQVKTTIWELIILSPSYFITACVKRDYKQEYMVKHITINHQILEQNNNYQDIEILYQES